MRMYKNFLMKRKDIKILSGFAELKWVVPRIIIELGKRFCENNDILEGVSRQHY